MSKRIWSRLAKQFSTRMPRAPKPRFYATVRSNTIGTGHRAVVIDRRVHAALWEQFPSIDAAQSRANSLNASTAQPLPRETSHS